MAEEQMINVNGKDYNVAAMTDQQRYTLNQIRSCDQKTTNLQFDIDQIQAAHQFFINNLTALLEEPTEVNVADQLN
jgi:hypothetical protein